MTEGHQIDIIKTIEAIVKLPAKNRLNAIIDHKEPLKLVRALSSHDILLTIREIGAEDALELVELLDASQVQDLLDLEIWDNDKLNPQKAGHYFSLLFEANADRAVSQIHGLDIELIGMMMKMVASIYDTSLGEEPYDYSNIYTESPGGRFIICFSDEPEQRSLSQALRSYIESLYGRDMKFVLGLIENIRFELSSGLEEFSHRLREGRLLDLGLLPRDERLAFFATISPGQLTGAQPVKLEKTHGSFLIKSLSENISSAYPFLQRGIAQCSADEQASLLDYLSYITINMHASLTHDFGDREQMAETANYTKALGEIALMQITQGDINQAHEVLRANSLKNIIRLGRTSLVNLRRLLQAKMRDDDYLLGPDFCYLDSPLREVARALCLSEPRFYEGLLDPKKLTLRFFSHINDIDATLKAVNEIKFRSLLLGPKYLGCTKEMLKQHHSISHAQIYGRFLVNSYLDKTMLADISTHDLKKISSKEFNAFAKSQAHSLSERLSYDAERIHNFSTSVLILLEQNYALLLG